MFSLTCVCSRCILIYIWVTFMCSFILVCLQCACAVYLRIIILVFHLYFCGCSMRVCCILLSTAALIPGRFVFCRPGYLCYLAAMSTLDAVLEEKMGALAKEKSAKQSGKARLIADPYITTNSLVECLGNFKRHKASKDLWSLISPPPGFPSSYGWHSLPHGEWLLKASSLLYELLGVL